MRERGLMTRVGALVLGILLLAAPASAAAVRDMLDRAVAVAAPPRRIVSLDPSVTEVLFALGAEDRLAGVTDYCDFPAAARRKPRVGDMLAPSIEAIVALRPDVVIVTADGNSRETVSQLERVGIPVYATRAARLADVADLVLRLGELTGRAERAASLVAGLERRIDAVTRAVAGRPRPRVLYVLWADPLIVPGRDTLVGDLVRVAGGESVTAGDGGGYPRLSLEAVVTRAPDVIVLADHGAGGGAADREPWVRLTSVPAVRARRLYEVDGNLLHRHGPRIVEGLELLARLFHPEAFR